MRVTEECKVEAGLGQEAVEQAGPVLHPPEPGLDQRGQLDDVVLDEVGQRPLEIRPDRLDRVEFVRVRREPVDRLPKKQNGYPILTVS